MAGTVLGVLSLVCKLRSKHAKENSYLRMPPRQQATNRYGQLKLTAMKSHLLLFSTIMSLFANGQTSVYHPFPDSNAVWNFHFQWYCFANGTADEFYSITFSGDTIISSQTYHKLRTPFVQSFSTGTCSGSQIGYIGAIRQDTAARKVFFVPPSDTTEQLLYDFTLQVGDTVRGFTASFAWPGEIVQSIDSILVGTTYRKRWIINNCYNFHFIEGIGSTYGLVEVSPGCVTDLPDYTLTCFQQDGNAQYPDTMTNCQIITSIQSKNKITYNVEAFPNPFKGSFTIDFGGNDFKELFITDLLGKIILRQSIEKLTQIKIDNLHAGTYLFGVIDRNGLSKNGKIISCP
jgi:hypothetical protein